MIVTKREDEEEEKNEQDKINTQDLLCWKLTFVYNFLAKKKEKIILLLLFSFIAKYNNKNNKILS